MIKQVKFLKSAASKKDWIEDEISEICFIGRSNVGKSSFINALTNQKKIAKISGTPGKTRLLNFYDINNGEYRIVDAPGYGYARVNNSQKQKFSEMMDEYLSSRLNLRGICQLVDLRHPPSVDDKEMYHFLKYHNIKVLIIATKRDKCKRNDILKNEKIIKDQLNIDSKDYFISLSSTSKENMNKVYDLINQLILII